MAPVALPVCDTELVLQALSAVGYHALHQQQR